MLVFWTLLYPVVMATLFSLAFSNLSSADAFSSVPVAVVDNAEYRSDAAFQSALDSVSDANASASQKLFHVTALTREQADDALAKNEIKGYILMENGAHVVVKESGVGQTILKEFVDSYLQARSAYGAILQSNPAAAGNFQTPAETAYLQDVAPGKADPDPMLIAYFALIAMAALFGGFWGNKEIVDIQADQSPQGARMNLAPVHKLKAFASSYCASVLVHFVNLALLVAYMGLVLNVSFGGQLPFVIVACLAGSLIGVSFGAVIGALAKNAGHVKIAILIGSSLTLSFLAGMMNTDVKYAVTHAVPALAWLNPANLIADAFYSLYYYSTYTRFFTNIALLAAFSAAFCLAVYFVTRRQRYASL
jgi:ABC-2 type transport system permease protein